VLLFGTVGIPLAVIGYPIAIWLPPFYAGELGISLATVGLMLMLARFSDVITDPLIGFLSDKWRTRWGRRKPWILAGTPVMVFGAFKLFIPPDESGPLYLLFWISFMFLGSTMVSLTYGAMGAELSADYHQRSRVTAAREGFVLLGLIIAAFVPAIVEFTGERDAGPVLEAMAWTIGILMPLTVFLLLAFVKEPAVEFHKNIPFREGLRHVWRNGPMKRVLMIVLLVTFAESFRNALSVFFMRDLIGVPAIGILYFYYFASGLIAIPAWLLLGKKIGKHKAFALCMVAVSCVSIATFFLERGQVTEFTVLFIAKGACFGGLQFLPLSMLADVVDVDSARSGGRRAGVVFAISGMTVKLAVAIGTGVSLQVLGLVGYVAERELAMNNGSFELMSLAVLYAIVPPIFFFAALWLTWHYPLTAERHARLRGLMERRAARLAEKAAGGS
jgi:GPH family glycoside/pentoside/hexuronide:cation symporter